MVQEHYGKCRLCHKELRWSYSGQYRAYYCDTCKKTNLEKWDTKKNIWVKEATMENQR